MVRDIAVIAFAQMKNVRRETVLNEVEMLMPVIEDVRAKAGLTQQDIGFTCSGSTDYLSGQAFSFVSTLDGVGPWPPIQESHVEMDGALALYEAWVKLQLGELDTALVYCYGKSAPGPDPRGPEPPARPVPRGPAVARCHQPRRPAGPGLPRVGQGDRGRLRRGRHPQPPERADRTPTPSWPGTARSRSTCVAPRGRPAPQGRLPADHRRGLRGDPRRRRQGPGAPRSPGVDPGHRPPDRADGPRRPRPHLVGLHRRRGRASRRRRRATTSSSCTPRSAPRS